MKKSLVLAMALSLGIAGTAFAANPFTDVPANHWAYTSVAKLAQAGIVEGYGDDTFRGGRNITRYEMAQMVAKAMAKVDQADASQKAMIEKLAAEFSAELENLGVRVAKLEKNADNVKITGEMRLRYRSFSGSAYAKDGVKKDEGFNETKLRTRLNLSGEINDNWRANMMLENETNLQTNGRGANDPDRPDKGFEDDTKMRRAWVQGKVGDLGIKAGRFAYTDVNAFMFDANEMDGVALDFGKDLKATILYGRMTDHAGSKVYGTQDEKKDVDALGLALDYKWNRWHFNAAYYNFHGKNDYAVEGLSSNGVFSTDNTAKSVNKGQVYVGYKFNEDWKVAGQLLHTNKDIMDSGKIGYTGRVDFKGMNVAKKGTWGIYVMGYSAPAGVLTGDTFGLDTSIQKELAGIQGWEVGADYALMKNVRLHLSYNDSKEKGRESATDEKRQQETATAYLQFFF